MSVGGEEGDPFWRLLRSLNLIYSKALFRVMGFLSPPLNPPPAANHQLPTTNWQLFPPILQVRQKVNEVVRDTFQRVDYIKMQHEYFEDMLQKLKSAPGYKLEAPVKVCRTFV